MSTYVTEELGYRLLAEAIVVDVVNDYKKAVRNKEALLRKLRSVDKKIAECEKFFNSEYGELLSNMEGEYIILNATETAKRELKDKYIVTVEIKSRYREKENND